MSKKKTANARQERLEAAGMAAFFGVPEFETAELLRVAPDGRGVISCLELPGVASRPELFSTFLMWLLADLFQDLPEVGDAVAGGVQCEPVVGEQALGHPTGGDALVEHGDGRLAGLRAGDQPGDRQAGVVVVELEDDDLASAGEYVLGGVQLPADVGAG